MHVADQQVNFEDEMKKRFAEMGMELPDNADAERDDEAPLPTDGEEVIDSELSENASNGSEEQEEIVLEPAFHCSRCGACCMSLDGPLSEMFADFDTGLGICKFLDRKEECTCTIYEQRPLLCNIAEGYKAFFKNDFTWEEFLDKNYESCVILRKKLNIPEPENPRGNTKKELKAKNPENELEDI